MTRRTWLETASITLLSLGGTVQWLSHVIHF